MQIGSRVVVLALSAALLVAPLTGCTTSKVTVRLPGFANGSVDGLWFWRLESGRYKRACRIDLSNPFLSGGKEVVNYRQTCLNGPTSAPWQAVVKRQSSNPQTVTLVLTYRRSGSAPAPHRATAFNPSGESALSVASLTI